MPIDNFNATGPTSSSQNNKRSANLYPHPVLARVKDNIDAIKSGSIWVYVVDQGAEDSDDKASWVPVKYLSPFYGTTKSAASGTEYGDYVGNPHSYGMWASAPDIGTLVVCVFINGSPNFGYYIGCVPEPEKLFMVPAIGSSSNITVNPGEAEAYGGATRLPVTNINTTNEKISESSNFINQAKPVHSYVAAILHKQGLIRDKYRGTIGSSAQRESPSRVFGLSTPGRPIYEGGFTDSSIVGAVTDGADSSKLKIIGRRGGHSVVLDDGDISGEDQLVRIRTSAGHQIMMNDTSQSLTIIHSNGLSWIELGAEGTIDLYASNSVNVRTQGDLNLHADRNMNLFAAKKMNIKAEEITLNSDTNINFRSVANTSFYAQGKFGISVDGALSLLAKGDVGLKSEATTYINGGSRVNLETGQAAYVPEKLKELELNLHDDTVYSSSKGFIAVPGKLASIASRAPTHFPWNSAGKGVDVKIDFGPSSPAPSPAVAKNNTPTEQPESKLTPQVLSTVPSTGASDPVKSAMIGQQAVETAKGAASAAVQDGAAKIKSVTGETTVAVGVLGLTAEQLASPAAGILKPGADAAIKSAIAQGKSAIDAIPAALFTGLNGVKDLATFTKSAATQVGVMSSMIDKSKSSLEKLGIITGKEKLGDIAGTVAATVAVGAAAVTKAINNPVDAFVNATGAGPLVAGIKNAINSGNYAAAMIKNLSGKFPSAEDVAKGFKNLKAGAPLDLLVGVGALALESKLSEKSSKLNDIAKTVAVAGAALTTINGLVKKIESLGDSPISKSIGELSLGLPTGIKLPKIVADTTNVKALAEQSKLLLGNAKIPPISFASNIGKSIPKIPDQTELFAKVDELVKLQQDADKAKETFLDLKEKLGADAERVTQALASWQSILKKISK